MNKKIQNIEDNDGIKVIEMAGEVLEDVTLENLKEQAGDVDLFNTLVVKIASPGGSVSEGLYIMIWLDLLSSMGKEIITVVTANAYSIASLIMLAADKKIISKYGKVMVHNPMIPLLEYANADELEEYASELRELEATMYSLYHIFTGLSIEKIKVLMDNETYLTPEEAVENGFADIVLDINKRTYEMSVNNQKPINMSKTLNALNKVIAKVNKTEFVDQLYYVNEGGEINIAQKDPSSYSVGDRTSMEAGEVKLSDGSMIKIVDFVIDSIDTAVAPVEAKKVGGTKEEVKDDSAEAVVDAEAKAKSEVKDDKSEGGKAKIEAEAKVEVKEEVKTEVKAEVKTEAKVEGENVKVETEAKASDEAVAGEISEVSKWEMEVINETFSLGDKVEYPGYDGESPKAVNSGEYELKDGRKILVDSAGIIKYIEAAPVKVSADQIIIIEAKEGEVTNEVKEENKADDKENFNVGPSPKLDDILTKMKQSIENVSNELTELKEDNIKKFKEVKKFEDVATTAIDAIAGQTSTNFSPDAAVIVKEPSTGSIFSQMKKRAGIE